MPGFMPGHPRLHDLALKTWMAGTSPAMTLRDSPAMTLGMWCPSSHSSCAGLIRASTSLHLKKEDVDGRDEPGHDAARQSGHDAEFVAPLLLIRHARTWCGHPRLCISASKTWMAGTSPAMTLRVNPAMTLNGGERPSGGTKPLSQFCIAR